MGKKHETLMREWRPEQCGTRLGDIMLQEDGKIVLKIKCRRCTKVFGRPMYHVIQVGSAI